MGFGEAAEPTKLVVSELHTHISGSDLKEVFAPFGAVVGIEVQTANGQPDGPSIGVAVVTFEEAAHAKDAQAAINGLELAGKNISVQFVQEIPQALTSVTPGLLPSLLGGAVGACPCSRPSIAARSAPRLSSSPPAPGIAPARPPGSPPARPPSSGKTQNTLVEPDLPRSGNSFHVAAAATVSASIK